MEKKKGFQMPHTYSIIFGVILFAALLTVFIPLGKYDTKEIRKKIFESLTEIMYSRV